MKQRFELKFVIPEETATRVRDFVQCHLDFDEHSADKPNYSYAVQDVYIDAEDLRLYWSLQSYKKRQNRYQLRLRSYHTDVDEPVFFETKWKIHQCYFKQRAAIHRGSVPLLLEGQGPVQKHLLTPAPQELVALQDFCQLAEKIRANPRLRVSFQREAYSSDDKQLRLTIDREVSATVMGDYAGEHDLRNPSRCYNGKVVLEVKFSHHFPEWVRQLVVTFGLTECETCRYVEAVNQLGLQN